MGAKVSPQMTPEERTERESAIVCKTLFQIQGDFDLKDADMSKMLDVSKKTLDRWEGDGKIPSLTGHLREASSHLIAIFRNLITMFSNQLDRQAWLKTKHPQLEKTPIELMRESFEGLIHVRRYLDFVRGRGA